MPDDRWKTLALEKKKRQRDSIPQEWLVPAPSDDQWNVLNFPIEAGLLTAFEIEITESNVEALLPKLATGEWTAVDVTRAFYKRAILAQQVVNYLTEIFVEKALNRAMELDFHLKNTGEVVGPMHGLPISLKDQLPIKGLETIMGYVSWVGKYADRDAALVEILVELGAVPFVRTNLPQNLGWAETFNHVFGRTTNPYNRSLTCGGSSGGEGALLGLRGSPLGVGSDTGGSIRIPSAFNGVYGLRPSFHRIPSSGALNSMEGQESLPSVFGPMANSIFGIKTFMKAVIDAKPWRKDPLALRQPWNQAAYELVEHGGGRQLVFGILWNNGSVVPHPPVRRALELVEAALVAAGHKVVDWAPYKHIDLYDVAWRIWLSACVEDFTAVTSISGEPLVGMLLPGSLDASPNENLAVPATKPVTAYELWQLHKRRLELRKEYLDYWEATSVTSGTGRPVDAIISPVAPFGAPPQGVYGTAPYTGIWNALDFPALAFPVTKVDPEIDTAKPAHDFLSKEDAVNYALYTPERFLNAPVGLQLIGRTQEEEAVIGMGEIVDMALKTHAKL